jgi:hypothetical protein
MKKTRVWLMWAGLLLGIICIPVAMTGQAGGGRGCGPKVAEEEVAENQLVGQFVSPNPLAQGLSWYQHSPFRQVVTKNDLTSNSTISENPAAIVTQMASKERGAVTFSLLSDADIPDLTVSVSPPRTSAGTTLSTSAIDVRVIKLLSRKGRNMRVETNAEEDLLPGALVYDDRQDLYGGWDRNGHYAADGQSYIFDGDAAEKHVLTTSNISGLTLEMRLRAKWSDLVSTMKAEANAQQKIQYRYFARLILDPTWAGANAYVPAHAFTAYIKHDPGRENSNIYFVYDDDEGEHVWSRCFFNTSLDSPTLLDDTWQRLTFVWDSAETPDRGSVQLYLDSVRLGTCHGDDSVEDVDKVSTATIGPTWYGLYVGANGRAYTLDDSFPGEIDYVRVYESAVASGDIAGLDQADAVLAIEFNNTGDETCEDEFDFGCTPKEIPNPHDDSTKSISCHPHNRCASIRAAAYRPLTLATQDQFGTDILTDKPKTIWIGLDIPPGQAPGRYQSLLQIRSAGTLLRVLPFAIDVLPFELESPQKTFGVFLARGIADNDLSLESFQAMAEDIAAHGANALELKNLTKEQAEILSNLGFSGPVLVDDAQAEATADNCTADDPPADDRPLALDQILGVGLDLYLYGMDEFHQDDRIDDHFKEVAETLTFYEATDLCYETTTTVKTAAAVLKGFVETEVELRTGENADTWQEDYPQFVEASDVLNLPIYHGTWLPFCNAENRTADQPDNPLRDYIAGLANNTITKSTLYDKELFYWQVWFDYPLLNRFFAGFYLTQSRLDGVMPYGYSQRPMFDYQADPVIGYDVGKVDEGENHKDTVVAFETANIGMVPTVKWEAYAAGIVDHRYAAMLSKGIMAKLQRLKTAIPAAANPLKQQLLQKAQQVLAMQSQMKERMARFADPRLFNKDICANSKADPFYYMADPYDHTDCCGEASGAVGAEDYDAYRRWLANAIIALNALDN